MRKNGVIDTKNYKNKKKTDDFSYINFDENKPTKSAKITLFILITLFAIGYFKYKPYEENGFIIDNFSLSSIFYLYFFVVNQALGIVHEGGHGVCYMISCPEFVTVLNGTIFQLLFPLGVGLYFYFKRQKIGFYTALFFLGISLGYTAWYISTSYKGPILNASESFLGVDAYHDFYYILDKISLLKHYKMVSFIVNLFANLIILISLVMLYIESFLRDDLK